MEVLTSSCRSAKQVCYNLWEEETFLFFFSLVWVFFVCVCVFLVFFFACFLSKTNLVSFSAAKEEGTNEKLITQEVNNRRGTPASDSVCHIDPGARACPKWLSQIHPTLALEDDAFLRDSFLSGLMLRLLCVCLCPWSCLPTVSIDGKKNYI